MSGPIESTDVVGDPGLARYILSDPQRVADELVKEGFKNATSRPFRVEVDARRAAARAARESLDRLLQMRWPS